MTYEEILQIVHDIEVPSDREDREISWLTSAEVLGVARDTVGHVEVFVVADPIHTRLRSIRENLEHETWYRGDGRPVQANRLTLPSAPHFEQVAAFLCTELIRNEVDTDSVAAFHRTERIIELAIERLRIGDDVVLGLFGEMLVLMALAEAVADAGLPIVIDGWTGHNHATRDLQLPAVGVEVKTTTGQTSSHYYQGVHQCEVGHGPAGRDETALFVASIGVEEAEPQAADALTLPTVVERTLLRVREAFGDRAGLVDHLLGKIQTYGAPDEGYEHGRLPSPAAFDRPLRIRFVRLYDMTDPAMLLLTSDDLAGRPFVAAESVRFRADFPERVTGDVNPVAGLRDAAGAILARAGLEAR